MTQKQILGVLDRRTHGDWKNDREKNEHGKNNVTNRRRDGEHGQLKSTLERDAERRGEFIRRIDILLAHKNFEGAIAAIKEYRHCIMVESAEIEITPDTLLHEVLPLREANTFEAVGYMTLGSLTGEDIRKLFTIANVGEVTIRMAVNIAMKAGIGVSESIKHWMKTGKLPKKPTPIPDRTVSELGEPMKWKKAAPKEDLTTEERAEDRENARRFNHRRKAMRDGIGSKMAQFLGRADKLESTVSEVAAGVGSNERRVCAVAERFVDHFEIEPAKIGRGNLRGKRKIRLRP